MSRPPVPDALRERLASARRVLITSHMNPDGDAVGSSLALAHVLRASGREATVWHVHPSPPIYRSLPGADAIHVGTEPPADLGSFDLGVVLECPTLDRCGIARHLEGLDLLNVDHHLGNSGYGVATWIRPEAPAVAVLVADLAAALGVELGPDAAACLFVGLATDTGGFRFPNASPEAFRAAAELVEAGTEVERVSGWLYESQPEGAVRLLGELLATLERHEGGAIASVHLTREAFERAGAAPGDSEGLIDVPRSIAGVAAVVMLRELEGGAWKASLRSRGPIDVEAVARSHGGGGHRNAAGCVLEGDRTTIETRLVAEVAAARREVTREP